MNLDGLKIIGKDVYKWSETDEWLLSGKIVNGIDGFYIEWFI
jgi:hypothetical protein